MWIANPAREAVEDADRLLESCLLVDVSHDVLRAARKLASHALRTLDAIHLASALHVAADELLTYDRRLIEAATGRNLAVTHPQGE